MPDLDSPRLGWRGFLLSALAGVGAPLVLFTGLLAAGWTEDWSYSCCSPPEALAGCSPERPGCWPKDCPRDHCYCEALTQGAIQQPANTGSNLVPASLGLLLAGLLLCGRPAPARERPHPGNLMATTRFFPAMYCALVGFLGTGSMFFHASLREVEGWIDGRSMVCFALFLLLYDAYRLLEIRASRTSVGVFLGLWGAGNVLIGALAGGGGGGPLVFGLLLGGAFALQAFVLAALPRLEAWPRWPLRPRRIERSRAGFLAYTGVFLLAMVVWTLSRTGGPLCDEQAFWTQGHAHWHVLAALAASLAYVYFRRERLRPAPAPPASG